MFLLFWFGRRRYIPDLTTPATSCSRSRHPPPHPGKFALVHRDAIDVFETYDDALKHGYCAFGLAPFLVKRIQAFEYPIFVSRLMVPCANVVTAPQKGCL